MRRLSGSRIEMDLTQFEGHTRGPWIAVGRWVEHRDDRIPDICATAIGRRMREGQR